MAEAVADRAGDCRGRPLLRIYQQGRLRLAGPRGFVGRRGGEAVVEDLMHAAARPKRPLRAATPNKGIMNASARGVATGKKTCVEAGGTPMRYHRPDATPRCPVRAGRRRNGSARSCHAGGVVVRDRGILREGPDQALGVGTRQRSPRSSRPSVCAELRTIGRGDRGHSRGHWRCTPQHCRDRRRDH